MKPYKEPMKAMGIKKAKTVNIHGMPKPFGGSLAHHERMAVTKSVSRSEPLIPPVRPSSTKVSK